jgi:hypothetical protein
MKISRLLLFVLLVSGFTACNDDEEDFFPVEIGQVLTDLQTSFDTLNIAMAAGAAVISLDVSDTSMIRSKLLNLYNFSTFSENFSFIDDNGLLQIIEPAAFYPYQGSDVSGQDHVIEMFQTHQPVLAKYFMP